MKRLLTAVALVLATAAAAAAQTNVEAAREELRRGGEQYRAGNYAAAQHHFERVIELDPSFRHGPRLRARAIMQQFKPGVATPENIAKGREALAAYEKLLADEPDEQEAFNAVVYLYRQLKDGDGESRWLWRHADDPSAPAGRRAVAYIILASKQWDCAYDITEDNKTVVKRRGEPSTRYVRPKSQADLDKARGCAEEGLRLVEEAARLDGSNHNAWSQKANLMRELSKLAEMEGDARLKDYYERQFGAALETHTRLAEEGRKRKEAGETESQANAVPAAGKESAASSQPADGAKKVVVHGGVLNGKAVNKPQPVYPPEAREAGAEGTVTVEITVDEEGRVVHARAVGGPALLHEAAVEAARRARFPQTFLEGRPVTVTGLLTYNFVLR